MVTGLGPTEQDMPSYKKWKLAEFLVDLDAMAEKHSIRIDSFGSAPSLVPIKNEFEKKSGVYEYDAEDDELFFVCKLDEYNKETQIRGCDAAYWKERVESEMAKAFGAGLSFIAGLEEEADAGLPDDRGELKGALH